MTTTDSVLVPKLEQSAESLRKLAGVIRQYGFCPAAALELIARNIEIAAAPTDAGGLPALGSVENIQTFARAYMKEVPNAELTVHGIAAGLEALATQHRAAVDEAMVERAVKAFNAPGHSARFVSENMREALVAALQEPK